MQAVKAEEPKLAQEAKTELTGAGGAGTAATPAATGAFVLSNTHAQGHTLPGCSWLIVHGMCSLFYTL